MPLSSSTTGDMSAALIFVATILCLLAWKVRKIFSYWEDKGIPHHGFWEYMRVVYETFTKPLHISVQDEYKKYGRLYGSFQDTDPCLVVAEPDLLREVCIKDFSSFVDRVSVYSGEPIWDRNLFMLSGEEWKSSRAIFSTAFTSSRLKVMVQKLARVANRAADVFVEHAEKKKPANLQEILLKSMIDAAAAVAFNADMDSFSDPENPFLRNYFDSFSGDSAWKFTLYFKMPRLFKLLRLRMFTKQRLNDFSFFVKSVIEDRIKSKSKVNDQIQIFLDAIETEAASYESGTEGSVSKKRLTIDDIVAQVFILLVGGSDTLSSTIIFLIFTLLSHPECEKKVIEEIDRVVGKEQPTYDMLQSMDYLDAALNETLRIFTPDSFLARICTTKTELQGIQLNPGNMIYIPIQAIHMDPEFYDEPEQFKPERFLPENKDSIRPFTFLPFGSGPRNCIGVRQAMLQMKTYVVCIYQKVKFERCSETIECISLKPRTLVRELREPIKLQPVRR